MLIPFQVLHVRHAIHLQKLLFETDTREVWSRCSNATKVISPHPNVGSDCVLPVCRHLPLHGFFQYGDKWILQRTRMILFFFFLKLYSVCRCVTVYFKFILIWGMYFGQWLYFRHCWNCEWCNICVCYNSSLFACLWVKCITFTRLQYNTTTRIDEDATLKGLKNTQNHSVTWTAAVYLYRWFQCDLMRFWMTWEDHTLTIKKKSLKKKNLYLQQLTANLL